MKIKAFTWPIGSLEDVRMRGNDHQTIPNPNEYYSKVKYALRSLRTHAFH